MTGGSGSISSWQKAKDAALVGFVVLASGAVVRLLADMADLKVSIAVYQTNQKVLETEVGRLRSDFDQHLRDDRQRAGQDALRRP